MQSPWLFYSGNLMPERNNINPAGFHVESRAAHGRAAVGHQTDAKPHHTSRSVHLRQWGADENQIDQE
ncbi:hypothetical protein [Halomonas cupida]|uniref:hypothetical protein n=1 Tax=Halomonas cupida TaxID=44933 RepID=UPI003A954054